MDNSKNLDAYYEERLTQLEEVKTGLERLKVNMNAMVRNMETMNAIGSHTFEQQPIARPTSSLLARDLDERSMGEEERL
ncbi:hypothetical protein MUCCIDRAFT_110073 [Mucor lusitanicus CBS 277.49]|uniref:Uncharacterized protein n=1 Tax=Mucor lusitanicus CBS 277.49 TaxID=747725 RepID=A0A168L829_MUCCL|nr:hypothetical protein MUCCIDRAFT_110073 [Mucor lusitanicus CBS 277.49]